MPYTEYMYNSRRYSDDKVFFNPPLVLKKKLCFKNVAQMPKVYQDKIIVSFTDGSLKSYAKDGSEIWETKISEKFSPLKSIFWGQTSIWNDKILAYYKNHIYSVYFENGKLLETNINGEVIQHCAVISGKLYINLIYNKIHDEFYYGANNLETNEMVWSHPFNSSYYDQILTGSNGRVIVYENNEELCCLETQTGKVLWRSNLRDVIRKAGTRKHPEKVKVIGTPMISGDNLYVAIHKKAHLACINLLTGETKWAIVLPTMTPRNATLYTDNRIYIFSNGAFVIIDAIKGKIIRKRIDKKYFYKYNFIFPTDMAVTDKFIYVADADHGVLYAIDIESLDLTWSHNIKCSIPGFSGPIIADDMLFILDMKRRLHVFEQKI